MAGVERPLHGENEKGCPILDLGEERSDSAEPGYGRTYDTCCHWAHYKHPEAPDHESLRQSEEDGQS